MQQIAAILVSRHRAVMLVVFVLCLVLSGCSRPMTAKAQAPDLVDRLIEVLNAKDQARLSAFVHENFTDEVPVATRVQRLSGLAEQGAPFKLVKVVGKNRSEIRAEVQDKNGERLGWIIELSIEGKIQRVQL